MEENKKKGKVTAIVITLLIVIILVLVGYICYDKGMIFKSNTEKVKNKEETVIENEQLENKMSEEKALSIGKKLYDNSQEYYINRGKLEMTTSNSNGVMEPVYYRKNADGTFIVAEQSEFNSENMEIPYYKLVIEELKETFTISYFEKFCSLNQIVEKDGSYYVIAGDRGGNISFREYELSVNKIEQQKISFNVKTYFLSKNQTYETYTKETAAVKNTDFVIELENGKWKVAQFTNVQ